MTWFIFIGDMLVMLFMVVLVIWLFMVTPDSEIDKTAMIPLQDEDYGPGSPGKSETGTKEAGKPHG